MNQPQHQLPKTMNYLTMSIDDIMKITTRLTTILAEESDLLGAMRVKELGPLQAEKQKLSEKLISFQRQLATDDRIVKDAPPSVREELLMRTDDLTLTIEENMRRTALAQAVNQRVMKTLTEAMSLQQRPNVYGRDGQANVGPDITVSITVNERA